MRREDRPLRRGRRGRRTAAMSRLAGERIAHLFALAEAEAGRPSSGLPTRYVQLARRIGMRYNVRIAPAYRDRFCRACSTYWVEGRTVSTRLRGGLRVRRCLACGRVRRLGYRQARLFPPAPNGASLPGAMAEPVLAGEAGEDEDTTDEGEDE